MPEPGRGGELVSLGDAVRARLEETHRAREAGLAACRRTIRACGRSIRAIHRLEPAEYARLVEEARANLREGQDALRPFPTLFGAGFLHDAEKEYAEARLTQAMVDGSPLANAAELDVGVAAWLNGLAEAASELRRHLLDRLRQGELDRAESLLGVMEDAYDMLVTIDYPDAITAGLRRTVDALRGVLERSRGDVTTATVQARLRFDIERATGSSASGAD
jgi:translin